MGFSWSSAIGQSCTLQVCRDAGIAEEAVLSMACAPPADQEEVVTVATDDTLFFHKTQQKGAETLERFDAALEAAGFPRNTTKDVNLADSMIRCTLQFTSTGWAVAHTDISVSGRIA